MGRPLQKKDHRTTKQDAAKYAKRHRKEGKHDKPFPPVAFHRDAFDRILAQPGCVGIRSYPGLTDANEPTMVLVGVDAAGNDMVDGALAQFAEPCPTNCSDTNVLNTD